MKLWKVIILVAILCQVMNGRSSRVILTPFPDSIHGTAIDTWIMGYPLSSLVIRSFTGCTTGVHIETRIFWIEWLYNLGFWLAAIWIVSKIPEEESS